MDWWAVRAESTLSLLGSLTAMYFSLCFWPNILVTKLSSHSMSLTFMDLWLPLTLKNILTSQPIESTSGLAVASPVVYCFWRCNCLSPSWFCGCAEGLIYRGACCSEKPESTSWTMVTCLWLRMGCFLFPLNASCCLTTLWYKHSRIEHLQSPL